jgi:hypothetical protein
MSDHDWHGSLFASGSALRSESRLRCAGDPRGLGPGSYNIRSEWAANSKHGRYRPAPGFLSGAPRSDNATATSPAPGTYDALDIDKAFKPVSRPLAPFGAGGARLPAHWTPTPGPGLYSTAPKWQKRSYNITLDDTVLA